MNERAWISSAPTGLFSEISQKILIIFVLEWNSIYRLLFCRSTGSSGSDVIDHDSRKRAGTLATATVQRWSLYSSKPNSSFLPVQPTWSVEAPLFIFSMHCLTSRSGRGAEVQQNTSSRACKIRSFSGASCVCVSSTMLLGSRSSQPNTRIPYVLLHLFSARGCCHHVTFNLRCTHCNVRTSLSGGLAFSVWILWATLRNINHTALPSPPVRLSVAMESPWSRWDLCGGKTVRVWTFKRWEAIYLNVINLEA